MLEVIFGFVIIGAGLWTLKSVLNLLGNLGGFGVMMEVLGEALALSSGSLLSNRKRERSPEQNSMIETRF